MRAYHRVDPLMDERKGHYSPAQFGAFLKVQLLAGRQSQRGHFRSLVALRGALPAAYARHVDFLVTEGDLDVRVDGSVYLDGWDEWQEGDLTVRDRMTALRNRRRNGSVPATVTGPSPTAIRSSVGIGIDDGANAPSGAHDPLLRVIAWLAARKVAVRSGSRVETDLATLVDQYDAETVVRTMAALPGGLKDAAQFVYGARNELNPLPGTKRSPVAKGFQPDTQEALDAFHR